MEYEFSSPKRRKLIEPDDNAMPGLKMHRFRAPLASETEIPTIEASSVVSSEIVQFGHTDEEKAQRAALAMKKAHRDKIEIAAIATENELIKQDEAATKAANKMQE